MYRQPKPDPSPHIFKKPFWSPPGTLGIQFFAWGEGGPSGNLNIKASTPIAWPGMFTDPNYALTDFGPGGLMPAFLIGMACPPPQGTPYSRPVNPFDNRTANVINRGVIRGMMKGPSPGYNGQTGG